MEKKFVCPCVFGVCMLAATLFGCVPAPVSEPSGISKPPVKEPEVMIKDLTLDAIEVDIDGLDRLKDCQFFLSKDVRLRYACDLKDVSHGGGIERTSIRRAIDIPANLPGILQPTANSGGKSAAIAGNRISVRIVFEEDDDASLVFQTEKK